MTRCQNWQPTRVSMVEGEEKKNNKRHNNGKANPFLWHNSHTRVSFIQSEIRSRNTSDTCIILPVPRGCTDTRLKHISKLNKLPSMRWDAAIVCVHLLSLSKSKVKHVSLNLFGLRSSFSYSESDTASNPNLFYLSLLKAHNQLSKQS